MEQKGHFVISLDFEINWGVWDVTTLDNYREHLLGVRKVIPGLIEIFREFEIEATFATVGFLFFKNKKELLEAVPELKPQYANSKLSPYTNQFNHVGEDEQNDPFHFAPSLIRQLKESGQEIGCHTFSHYYCLEEGQNLETFRADLQAAKKIAKQWGVELKSLVFPRNQFNEDYLEVCRQEGITSYRGNEQAWMYEPRNYQNESWQRRAVRLLDAYVNISGHHCYTHEFMKKGRIINIPSSRFLRQYKPKLSMLDGWRLRRIKNSMTYAAKHGLTYHLWWHPHNFGINTEKNFSFLRKILKHYLVLNKVYGFKSINMQQLASVI